MGKELLRRRTKRFIPQSFRSGFLSFLLFIALFALPHPVLADWSPLINRLVNDGFEESTVRDIFSRPEVKFEPSVMLTKLEELSKHFGKKTTAAPSQPSYNPKLVYKGYLKEKMITRARAYLKENMELLENISSEYCVPKEIAVSILLIETHLGESLGGRRAFNALASMALCTDAETIRPYLPKKLKRPGNEDSVRSICQWKGDWAYSELKALIEYASWSGLDLLSLPGSIYGAIGMCQFMPSNILLYGVDADQDGRIDLFTKTDALFSIANYLKEHGWKQPMDKVSQFRVILDYNKSSVYASTVLAVADRLEDKPRLKKRTVSRASSSRL
jgi:membrane-bound lytic murein transglycosylase B